MMAFYVFIILITIPIIRADFCSHNAKVINIFNIGTKIYSRTEDNKLWVYDSLNRSSYFTEIIGSTLFGNTLSEIHFATQITLSECNQKGNESNCDQTNNSVIAIGFGNGKQKYVTYKIQNEGSLTKTNHLLNVWGLKNIGVIDSKDKFWGQQLESKKITGFFYYGNTFFVRTKFNDKKHVIFWKTIEKNGSLPTVWGEHTDDGDLRGKSTFVMKNILYAIDDNQTMVCIKYNIKVVEKNGYKSLEPFVFSLFKSVPIKKFFNCADDNSFFETMVKVIVIIIIAIGVTVIVFLLIYKKKPKSKTRSHTGYKFGENYEIKNNSTVVSNNTLNPVKSPQNSVSKDSPKKDENKNKSPVVSNNNSNAVKSPQNSVSNDSPKKDENKNKSPVVSNNTLNPVKSPQNSVSKYSPKK